MSLLGTGSNFLRERKSCIFCKSDTFKPFVSFDGFNILKCGCGYIFMSPYLSEQGSRAIFSGQLNYDFPWLKDYNLPFEEGTGALIVNIYKRALDKLQDHFPVQGRVLDVGCGFTNFLDLARLRGWEVHGVDFGGDNVSKMKEKYNIDIFEGSLTDIPLAPESLDVITMWDYLEHVEDPKAILNKARKLLAPNGVLIIACPNHHSLLYILAKFLYILSGQRFTKPLPIIYPLTHLSYFKPSFLASHAKKSGYNVIDIEYDETDLDRINLNYFIKASLRILFVISRVMKLSNRFTIYLKKKE